MCMYLVDAMYLGNRLIGYEVYESKSMGFMGMTEKQILDKLSRNEKVYGFRIKNDVEAAKEVLELDEEGFNMKNLQVKSGVNTLAWLKENEYNDINIGLIVVKIINEKNKKPVYETVNARHARITYEESKLKMLIELGAMVAGVKLEKNKLVACEGVEISGEEKAGE